MRKFHFYELTKHAQIRAIYDYSLGWIKTHGEDDLSVLAIFDLLMSSVEEVYNYKGELLEEEQ